MIEMISIRPHGSDDVDGIYEAVRESIHELNPWLPWCHRDYARAETAAWVAGRPAVWEAKTEFCFAIASASGMILGGCGLNRIEHDSGTANLGYWVRTTAAGNGVATRAAELLREWAFTNTELHRLEILAAVGNFASQRVAEKVGATREGTLRQRLVVRGQRHDAVLYSILRSGQCS